MWGFSLSVSGKRHGISKKKLNQQMECVAGFFYLAIYGQPSKQALLFYEN
jgi:hypothetical protein